MTCATGCSTNTMAYLASTCDSTVTDGNIVANGVLNTAAVNLAGAAPSFTATVDASNLQPGRHYTLCTDLDGSTGTMPMGANDFLWYVTGVTGIPHYKFGLKQQKGIARSTSETVIFTCAQCTSTSSAYLATACDSTDKDGYRATPSSSSSGTNSGLLEDLGVQGRPVTVWCRPCMTLQSCGSKQQVEKNIIKGRCFYRKCKKGLGYMTWEDGSQYSSDWKKGKMHGNGTYTYADGEIYQGGWKNGLRDGQGNSTHANGEKYQGGWKSDFMDGQGTYTYADGAQYQGDWKEGVKDGQGTHTWTNGDKYQGQYKKNKRDGQGTFTSANGQKYQGEFKNGLPDGQGTVTLANGNMYKVWFKEGNLTKKVKEK
eukprot:symbB.v1.2.024793.t1/scaffold2372.1/size80857/3